MEIFGVTAMGKMPDGKWAITIPVSASSDAGVQTDDDSKWIRVVLSERELKSLEDTAALRHKHGAADGPAT